MNSDRLINLLILEVNVLGLGVSRMLLMGNTLTTRELEENHYD